MKKSLFLTGALVLAVIADCNAQSPNVKQVSSEIRAEATRSNNDPIGRALPLLSSWHTGSQRAIPGMTPLYQVGLVGKGHHVIPSFAFPDISSDAGGDKGADEAAIEPAREYFEAALKRAAQLRLPITLVSTQWERLLSDDKAYFDLPADKNPNVVTPEGKIENRVSPFGAVEPWREVGAKWASSPLMKQVQRWYPNPPLVILLSNNEHRKLTWKHIEQDARYLEKYGKGRDDDFKRRVIADGWTERYRALQAGMRDALAKKWRGKAIFVGYDAFGAPFLGRMAGWEEWSLHSRGRIDPYPLAWDGGAPSYYTDDWNESTDFRVFSPQVQSMNWVFMQREAVKLNPNFWFELSLWDGQEFNSNRGEQYKSKPDYYRSLGQTYGPQRYAGSTQFGLWLLRPRVVREYRGHTADLKSMEPYYLAIAGIVDRVYKNKTLQQFWRKGQLVPNRAHQHPFQAGIPNEWKNEDRWFLLDTNLDSPRPWKLDTDIPVFSLALTDGVAGNRRWLVYAHSPLQDRKGVEITVPKYGKITVDVPVAGAFYVVGEKAKSVRPVQ